MVSLPLPGPHGAGGRRDDLDPAAPAARHDPATGRAARTIGGLARTVLAGLRVVRRPRDKRPPVTLSVRDARLDPEDLGGSILRGGKMAGDDRAMVSVPLPGPHGAGGRREVGSPARLFMSAELEGPSR